jgi:DNA-directed RNA polymerase subunit RPC12/RpoP
MAKVCICCGKEFEGFGNSPEPLVPISEGMVCDECNENLIIPYRMADMKTRRKMLATIWSQVERKE